MVRHLHWADTLHEKGAMALWARLAPVWSLYDRLGGIRVMACAAAALGLCGEDCLTLPLPLQELRGGEREEVAAVLGGLGCCRTPDCGCHAVWRVVTPARFERATFPLGGGRSIQLSYGAIGSGKGYLVWLNGPSAGRPARLSK